MERVLYHLHSQMRKAIQLFQRLSGLERRANYQQEDIELIRFFLSCSTAVRFSLGLVELRATVTESQFDEAP